MRRGSLAAITSKRAIWSAVVVAGNLPVVSVSLFAQQGPALPAAGISGPPSTATFESARLDLRAPAWALESVSLPPSQFAVVIVPDAPASTRMPVGPGYESSQSGGSERRWPTALRVSLGALGGAATAMILYRRGCENTNCQFERIAVVIPAAALGGVAGFLMGSRDRTAMPDTGRPPDAMWERMRTVPVPPAPPDSLPSWIYVPGNVASPTHYVTRTFVPGIVMVAFHPWAPVHARQRAIDIVSGAVIGGEPATDGEGFYYVLIRDDRSGRGVREAVGKLTGWSGVAVAAPLYAEGR